MKCIVQGNEACRRCRRAGLPCIFVPRANAAQLPDLVTGSLDVQFKKDVLTRLQVIEDSLGLSTQVDASSRTSANTVRAASDEEPLEPRPVGPLWEAIACLQKFTPSVPATAWQRDTVEGLWSSYVLT